MRRGDTTFILGMHRSGTSCLTGCLERCGLGLADVSRTPRDWNRKGTLENLTVHSINERLIGSWLNPRFRRWQAWRLRGEIRECIARLDHLRHAGLKDPRFLFTLDAWLPHVPRHRLVGIFRNPLSVHLSLMDRKEGQVSERRNLAAWKSYNRRLLALQARRGFPLLCFDWSPEMFLRELRMACRLLGLTFDEASVAEFYDRSLRHQGEIGFLGDAEAEALYAELRRRAAPLRRVFLAGNPSSGTTVLMRALQELDFAQGPIEEGNAHPEVPGVLRFRAGDPEHNYRRVTAFSAEEAGSVDRWIRSFCTQSDWFFEKSPFHMSRFEALEDLYGDQAFFLVIQRDPEQTIASCYKRWGAGHPDYSIPIGHMLDSALSFDAESRGKLSHFHYVRYEDLCSRPVETLHGICSFLGVSASKDRLVSIAASLDIRTTARHSDVEDLAYSRAVYEKCQTLRQRWGYAD